MSEICFMCIPLAVESPGKSFEEARMADYIRSYSTTGRPPPPCPQEPVQDAQRSALGLPPLFKPFLQPEQKTDSKDLPLGQSWIATAQEGDESFQTLAGMRVYKGYSFDELRYYAYLKGQRHPPASVTLSPFVLSEPSSVLASFATDSNGQGDQLQAITTRPEYSEHSMEELRFAFMQVGRELTSSEIAARPPRPNILGSTSAAPAAPVNPLMTPTPTLRLF